jgi:hypothetical protein
VVVVLPRSHKEFYLIGEDQDPFLTLEHRIYGLIQLHITMLICWKHHSEMVDNKNKND